MSVGPVNPQLPPELAAILAAHAAKLAELERQVAALRKALGR